MMNCRHIMIFVVVSWFFLIAATLKSQVDPENILDSAYRQLVSYKEYSAEVEIEVDVDFIRIPVKYATMHFMEPDQVTFRSEDFIMLPKKGLDFSLRKILEDKYTAIFSGYDSLGGGSQYVVKVIPEDKRADIILAELWVDKKDYVIVYMENFTRRQGSYRLAMEYGHEGIALPSKISFHFEVERFNIPIKFMGKDVEVDKESLSEEGMHEGKVIIRLKDYQISPE